MAAPARVVRTPVEDRLGVVVFLTSVANPCLRRSERLQFDFVLTRLRQGFGEAGAGRLAASRRGPDVPPPTPVTFVGRDCQAGLAGGLAGGARRAPAFCEARVPVATPSALQKSGLPGDGPRVGARSNPAHLQPSGDVPWAVFHARGGSADSLAAHRVGDFDPGDAASPVSGPADIIASCAAARGKAWSETHQQHDPRGHRQHADGEDQPHHPGRDQGGRARQGRDVQPRQLDQGPHGREDDRGRRARRAAQAWRDHHRRDVGQHRDGVGDCSGREGL